MKTFHFNSAHVPAKASHTELRRLIKFLKEQNEIQIEFPFKERGNRNNALIAQQHVDDLLTRLKRFKVDAMCDQPRVQADVSGYYVYCVIRLVGTKGLAAMDTTFVINKAPEIATRSDFHPFVTEALRRFDEFSVVFTYDLPVNRRQREEIGDHDLSTAEELLTDAFRLWRVNFSDLYEVRTAERTIAVDGDTARTIFVIEPHGLTITRENYEVKFWTDLDELEKPIDERILDTLWYYLRRMPGHIVTFALNIAEVRESDIDDELIIDRVKTDMSRGGTKPFSIKKTYVNRDPHDDWPTLHLMIKLL